MEELPPEIKRNMHPPGFSDIGNTCRSDRRLIDDAVSRAFLPILRSFVSG
jgi:hypothetical protein